MWFWCIAVVVVVMRWVVVVVVRCGFSFGKHHGFPFFVLVRMSQTFCAWLRVFLWKVVASSWVLRFSEGRFRSCRPAALVAVVTAAPDEKLLRVSSLFVSVPTVFDCRARTATVAVLSLRFLWPRVSFLPVAVPINERIVSWLPALSQQNIASITSHPLSTSLFLLPWPLATITSHPPFRS